MRQLVALFLVIGISLGTGKGLYCLKKGFSSRRIHSLSLHTTDTFTEEAKAALKQTFRFLGRGRQCFAFESEDGKYVLKFPRTDIYKTPFWARVLPVKAYRGRLEKEHAKREQFIVDSFHIAAKELQEQTAIVALHLGQSDSKEKLTVIDAMGCKHRLPLGKTSFVLQQKHPLWTKAFLSALHQDKKDEAKKILEALVEIITERASKGVLNRDRSFLRNYGFDGQKAYQIDVGSFFKNETMPLNAIYQKSLHDSIDPVQEWLSQIDPEMLEYLNAKLVAR